MFGDAVVDAEAGLDTTKHATKAVAAAARERAEMG